MNFGIRLLVCEITAFLLFPLAFIILRGPDEAGWIGDYILMLFVQFISPYGYWLLSVAFGLVATIVWQCVANRRTPTARSGIGPIYADCSDQS